MQNKQTNMNISFKEKYLDFFKKNLKYSFLSIIILCFLEFFFMFVIIFHYKISAYISIIEYILFSFNFIVSTLLIYPSYIYSNKSFLLNNFINIIQILFLCFLIPITIYFHANIWNNRINNTITNITIDLTKWQFIYVQFSLWLCFIMSGSSLILSIIAYYFSSKLCNKPWKIRVENERVISKPSN